MTSRVKSRAKAWATPSIDNKQLGGASLELYHHQGAGRPATVRPSKHAASKRKPKRKRSKPCAPGKAR